MRALLYYLALLLSLPQVLICAFFLLLGHVTKERTLGSFFLRTLDLINALFTWGGLLVLAAVVALIVAGLDPLWRRVGAGAIATILLASGIWMLVQDGPIDWGFFVPGVLAMTLAISLATRPAIASTTSSPRPVPASPSTR